MQVDALPAASPTSAAQLRCLLICDLADSTALIDKLGDARAAELMRQHDRVARETLQRAHGREIDKTDGFLLLFERPIEAVRFALDYQRALRQLGAQIGQPLRARVGIHVGEILSWQNRPEDIAEGAKPIEVEGLAKAIAARLMSLADAGQILLSESAHSLALRARTELNGELRVRWIDHGRYRIKGVAAPLHVFEVGEDGPAPLNPPSNKPKAHRIIPWYRWKPLYALLVLAAIAWPLYYALQPTPAIAFAERDWIVVGDLRNLSSEPMFNESLDVAFRVALEQSQYVNVVSTLSVQRALERMQLPVESTPIDRVVGAEVALREDARALIVPSITEIGGRVRVIGELIDPISQATVYSAIAEGEGYDSVLQSVDIVARDLRSELRESSEQLKATSLPLPAVATARLDALRTYAVANKFYVRGQRKDALALFAEALKLDPQFDLARAGLARVLLSSGDLEGAQAELEAIPSPNPRLSHRMELYVDALRAQLASNPSETMERWKRLFQIYPDSFGAYSNYANLAAIYFNDYERALEIASKAVSARNPMAIAVHEDLARIRLARGEIEQAAAELESAKQLGSQGTLSVYFNVAATRFDFAAAEKALPAAHHGHLGEDLLYRQLDRVALQIEQSEWRAVLTSVKTLRDQVRDSRTNAAVSVELAVLDLQSTLLGTDKRWLQELFEVVEKALAVSGKASQLSMYESRFNALRAAILAARSGYLAASEQIVSDAVSAGIPPGFPLLNELMRLTLAAQAAARDDFAKAAAELAATDEPLMLFASHLMRARILSRTGTGSDFEHAVQWLIAHRGLAYSETNLHGTLKTSYLVETQLLYLDAAESALLAHDRDEARSRLALFVSTNRASVEWPKRIQNRIDAIRRELEGPGWQNEP